MNSIVIACTISLATAYMLTVSYHSYYLYETVLLLENQKRSFYCAQQLLAQGIAYYKKHGKKLTLPYTLNQQIHTKKSQLHGVITIDMKNNQAIEVIASLYENSNKQAQARYQLKATIPGSDY
jgi:hypothetical protein